MHASAHARAPTQVGVFRRLEGDGYTVVGFPPGLENDAQYTRDVTEMARAMIEHMDKQAAQYYPIGIPPLLPIIRLVGTVY